MTIAFLEYLYFKSRLVKHVFFLHSVFFLSLQSFSQADTQSRFIPIEKSISYRLGEKKIILKVFQYGEVKDLVYVNVHDNESTSVEAAKSLLEINGGTLLKIENNQQRSIRFRLKNVYYTFDPNRIFSRIGIEQTLRIHRRISASAIIEIEKFAKRILELITDSTSCIIALHNNTDGAYSIKSYLPGNDRQSDARAVYSNQTQDLDDLALTTDSILYQKMADHHYNTVWQDNKRAKRDGSLSIYCGERNWRYINIETENGKFTQHREMLEKLMVVLGQATRNLASTGASR